MTNAEARFNKSHIRKVYACLAVTCHLHFWQNDRDFLRATVVTRGWNGYQKIRVSTESRSWRRKFSRRSSRDSNPRPFNHESGALTTELSPPPPTIQASGLPFVRRGAVDGWSKAWSMVTPRSVPAVGDRHHRGHCNTQDEWSGGEVLTDGPTRQPYSGWDKVSQSVRKPV